MKYKCENNLDKFYFGDANIEKCECQDGHMTLVMDGAAVRYNNPANETLTDRYIDMAQVRLKDMKIRRLFLEGARYYDANDVLMREVPDQEINQEDYEKMFRMFSGASVFTVEEKEASDEDSFCCEIALDVTDEEADEMSTYWMEIEYKKAVTEWEHFLNKMIPER